MRKFLLIIFLTLTLFASEKRIEPKAGIFITSLHSIDISNRSFDVIFWSWFVHKSPSYKPYLTTEITNIKDVQNFYELEDKIKIPNRTLTFKGEKKIENVKNQFVISSYEKNTSDFIWHSQKLKATILHNWNLKNYPFDEHALEIKIEDADLDCQKLKFIPDIKNSGISKELKLDGWDIKGFKISEKPHIANTNYGDPTLNDGKSSYSEITATIYIKRDGLRDFLNIFIPIYLAFFVSWLGYFIHNRHDTKVSLFLASVFMLIGNKYIIDSTMPPTTIITLVDKVQILTFIAIAIFIFVVTVSMFLNTKEAERLEKRLNKYVMIGVTLFYILGNFYLFKDIL